MNLEIDIFLSSSGANGLRRLAVCATGVQNPELITSPLSDLCALVTDLQLYYRLYHLIIFDHIFKSDLSYRLILLCGPPGLK